MSPPPALTVQIPLRTSSGLNVRENWRARARRVKAERGAVTLYLSNQNRHKPTLPCVVTLTRIAPSNGLDPFDNLPASLKGCVDAVAEWLGVDDKRSNIVRYECRQQRGPWSVRIEFAAVEQAIAALVKANDEPQPEDARADSAPQPEAVSSIERCRCGYPMPCAKNVPITLCRA